MGKGAGTRSGWGSHYGNDQFKRAGWGVQGFVRGRFLERVLSMPAISGEQKESRIRELKLWKVRIVDSPDSLLPFRTLVEEGMSYRDRRCVFKRAGGDFWFRPSRKRWSYRISQGRARVRKIRRSEGSVRRWPMLFCLHRKVWRGGRAACRLEVILIKKKQ